MRAFGWVGLSAFLACAPPPDGFEVPADAGGDDMEALLAAGPPLDVYLIAGQSNAVGGARLARLPAAQREIYGSADLPFGFAQELNCATDLAGAPCELSTGWDRLAPRAGSFGIELSAGRRLRDRFGADVAIIKHASNGASLFADWHADGVLWGQMNEFVDARLAELPDGSRIAGLFWIHGNADAKLADAADDYAENLSWFITRLREERGCLPVVIDRLHIQTPPPYRDVVRREQEGLGQLLDHVVVVDTDDLALRDDPPQHYAAASFITLGERMADAMPTCD